MDSKEVSNAYYDRLSRRGLESQVPAERTVEEVAFIQRFFGDKEILLDAACGYGRLAIPLAEKGHTVSGVDLSEEMIEHAGDYSEQTGVHAEFLVADMQRLPFDASMFTRIICWWSAFNSLLLEREQLDAINEMRRVLKDNGLAMIDLPDGDSEHWLVRKGDGDEHVVKDYFVGGGNAIYLHDSKTMRELCKRSDFSDFEIRKEWIGQRKRMIVLLRR